MSHQGNSRGNTAQDRPSLHVAHVSEHGLPYCNEKGTSAYLASCLQVEQTEFHGSHREVTTLHTTQWSRAQPHAEELPSHTSRQEKQLCMPPSCGSGHQATLLHQGGTLSSYGGKDTLTQLPAPRHGAGLLMCHTQLKQCVEAVLRVRQLQTAGTSPQPAAGTAGPKVRGELLVNREEGRRTRRKAASSLYPLGESDPHSQALLLHHCNWIKPQEDSFILLSLNCVSAGAPY